MNTQKKQRIYFAKALKENREKNNLTMLELAEKVGISENAVRIYESGDRMPDFNIIKKLSECLKCDFVELVSKRLEEKEAPANQLIFEKKALPENHNVRVRIEDHCAEIVNSICLQTGLSATHIVSRMIDFAYERVVITPPVAFKSED